MGVGGVNGTVVHLDHPARLVICDARPLVRLGLSAAFAGDPDFEITLETITSDTLVDTVSRVQPQLLLIHTRVPPAGALLVIPELRRKFPYVRVLGLADTPDPLVASELLRLGASGIAHVAEPAACIVSAARTTLQGSRYLASSFDSDLVDSNLRDSPLGGMTEREREVFVLLGRGNSNAKIARQLFISVRTVETHRQRIMHKLDAHSICEVVVTARRLGVIGWTRSELRSETRAQP